MDLTLRAFNQISDIAFGKIRASFNSFLSVTQHRTSLSGTYLSFQWNCRKHWIQCMSQSRLTQISPAYDLKTSRVLSLEVRGYRGILLTPLHGHFLHHTRLNCSRHSGYENWDLKTSSEFDFLDWQRSSKSNTLHLNSCLDSLASEKFRSLQLRFCCKLNKDKMNPKFTVLIGGIIKTF